MIRGAWRAAALIATARSAIAQTVVQLRGPTTGIGPDVVVRALAGPHVLVERGSSPRFVRRDSAFTQTVITVGRTIIVEGRVHGDLIAVGADVYIHPGARVDGRVVSIGGGVYESMLAQTGQVIAFHDFTYGIEATPGGYTLTYLPVALDSAPAFHLPGPGAIGLRIPTYDRMNGLSLRLAPMFGIPGTGVVVEPGVTYRSNLGRLDPGVIVTVPVRASMQLAASVERTTPTNDGWIRSDLINSLDFLFLGDDTRNYYRATRGSLMLTRPWRTAESTVEPYVGARVERGRSLARDSNATGAPWTLLSRKDPDDARRPNPAIDAATVASAIAGARLRWISGPVVTAAEIEGELGTTADDRPLIGCAGSTCSPASFGQLTLTGRVSFPTFGTQSLTVDAHAVATRSRRTPRQRWGHIGGPGSVPTLELLERGGDELVFADFRYAIPVNRLLLPVVGPPTITLREVLGGAAVGAFPNIAQAVGARLSVSVFYAELLVDPVHRRTAKGFGISLGR